MYIFYKNLACICLTSLLLAEELIETKDLTMEEGHLKPFGQGRPNTPVETVSGFPEPRNFFERHVLKGQPLLMRGAVKNMAGFRRWTDNYLQSVSSKFDHVVSVDTVEGLKFSANLQMSEFLEKYAAKSSYMYMSTSVPEFFK